MAALDPLRSPAMRSPAFLVLTWLVLAAGCGRCGSEPNATPNASRAKPGSPLPPTPAPTAVPPAPKPAAASGADTARAAASALLDTWKAAQNKGDAEAYFALYEPKEFKGLKRTHRGKVANFDFPAWRKDRSAMFKNAFEVAVEDPRVETWLDPKSTLKPGITSVRFLQRWRSKNYADHGPKSFLLWRDPRDGKTRIVFEELLLSRPGWEAVPRSEPPSLPAVAAAATVEEMTAALNAAGLNASSAGDVAIELEDPHARGLALRAVAEMGSFDCVPEIMIGYGCGEEGQDWGLAEATTIEHPCMRRALVLPLLEGAALPRDALLAAAEELSAILEKPAPEEGRDPDFVRAVLHAIEPLPEADQLPFLAEALYTPQWVELAAPLLAKLSPESLYALWEKTKNPAALRPLPLDVHAARLAEIQANADLPNDLILPVVPVLAAQNRRDLLAARSNDTNCELAMAAAAALAALGDGSKLPTWKAATDTDAGKRVICRLRHDPDRARALAELRQFFHPTRKARSVYLKNVYNEFRASYDDEGNEVEPEPPSVSETNQAIIDEAHGLLRPEGNVGGTESTASIDTFDQPAPEALMSTHAFDERDATEVNFEMIELFEENGHLYVDYLGTFEYEWHGCPC